jgi:hypothetical protein
LGIVICDVIDIVQNDIDAQKSTATRQIVVHAEYVRMPQQNLQRNVRNSMFENVNVIIGSCSFTDEVLHRSRPV